MHRNVKGNYNQRVIIVLCLTHTHKKQPITKPNVWKLSVDILYRDSNIMIEYQAPQLRILA